MLWRLSLDGSYLTSVRKEAARVEEDATFSSKSQFEAHDFWDNWHNWIGIPAVIIGAAGGTAIWQAYLHLPPLS
jgi:hypothetical protein